MSKTFDLKAYQLAAQFLADETDLNTEAARITLAMAIQDCIEDELMIMRSLMEKAS